MMRDQDMETREDSLFGSNSLYRGMPEEMPPDFNEDFSSSPPSPIDGDIASLPLSEEIQKQKKSKKKTNKILAVLGVVGVLLLLVLIPVLSGVDGALVSTAKKYFPKKYFPTVAQKLGVIKSKLNKLGLFKENAEKQKAATKIAEKNQLKEPEIPVVAVAKEPENYFIAGIDYHNAGKDSEAIKAFRIGMEKNPELKEIGFNNTGVIFSEKGEYKKGISYFKQALKINPRYADAHYNLASAYERMKNGHRALFHYQRFIELAEKDYSQLTMRVKKHVEE